jgi:hypothetical protein
VSTALILGTGGSNALTTTSAPLQITVTVNVPVRSLTVNVVQPTKNAGCLPQQRAGAMAVLLTRDRNCQLPLGTVVITNGETPSHVDVAGSDAVPADAAKHWTLCGDGGQPCTGKSGRPGRDQFQATTLGGTKKTSSGTILRYAPLCDTAFDQGSGCNAASGQTANEGLAVLVPSLSTDTSTTFTTLVAWTAAP